MGDSSISQHRKSNGPKLEKLLEDDEFIPELRQRNEVLLK
jgi:hypothetical protein